MLVEVEEVEVDCEVLVEVELLVLEVLVDCVVLVLVELVDVDVD